MEYRIKIIQNSNWLVDEDGFVFSTTNKERAEDRLEIFSPGEAEIVEIEE